MNKSFIRLISVLIMIIVLTACKTYDNASSVRLKKGKKIEPTLGSTSHFIRQITNLPDSAALRHQYGLDTMRVFIFSHFFQQDFLNRWRAGNMSVTDLEWGIRTYHIDTSKLSQTTVFDAETILVMGRTGDDCIVIPDYNNNNTLTDDKPILFSKFFSSNSQQPLASNKRLIKIENLNGFYDGKTIKATGELEVHPFKKDSVRGADTVLKSWNLNVYTSDYYAGRFKVGRSKYHVAAKNRVPSLFVEKNILLAFTESVSNRRFQSIGDTILLDGRKHIIGDILRPKNILVIENTD